MKIKLSSIMVENQATALAFYTDILGFKKSKDIPVGEFRWITVVSPEGYPDVELFNNVHVPWIVRGTASRPVKT